ncbi:MAG: hypothetical protein OXH73_17270 [Caldilineaceae bacterium]|nr:hypothetical protein [Caldilineaceae bacterium]
MQLQTSAAGGCAHRAGALSEMWTLQARPPRPRRAHPGRAALGVQAS